MAELANRDEIERRFTKRMAALTNKQKAELRRLLGNPPNPANVPASFWQQAERELEEDLLALLLLIVATSAVQHGMALPKARDHGRGYAGDRAKTVSKSFWQTTKDRLQKMGERWQQQRERGQVDPVRGEGGGVPGASPTSPPAGPTEAEIMADLEKLLGIDRIEAMAVSETTAAASAGGEGAAAAAGTATEEDTWFTARDQRVCPICAPLHGTRRSNWTRFFPSGPPAHPWCRCWIEYATPPATPPTPPQQSTP